MALVEKHDLNGAYIKLGFDDYDGKACNCGKFYMVRTINEALRGDGTCIPPVCP